MSKKIIISESQYRRVFLREQGYGLYDPYESGLFKYPEKSWNVSNQVAKYYRLWANSTPELSKKYGKESEFDLDATRKDPTSGTFNKSYSQGKSQFDKDWLIVPHRYSYQDGDPKYGGRLITDEGKSLFFTKGGEIIYKVNTKKVLPEKLSSKVLIYRYVNGREEIVDLDEDYWYDGRDIYKEVNKVYSSPNTKRATDVIEQEKKEDKEKLDAEIKSVKDSLKSDFGFTSDVIEGNLSQDHVVAQTVLNAMRKLNDLTKSKVNTGVKGKYDVCVKGFGTCTYGAGGKLYVANDFEDLANKINYRTDIGGHPASYVVDITTVEFDFGLLQQELNDAFKRDKNARNSKSFPNGWWSFFTSYYGDNYSKVYKGISGIQSYEIKDNKETLNVYEPGKSVWSCFEDYHCILDLASIAALAIPGWGLIASAGFDFVNAGFYASEYVSASSYEEKRAAALGAAFSLLGGLIGGGGSQALKYSKTPAKNPKVYSYVEDYVTEINKRYPNAKNMKEAKKISVTDEVAKIEKDIAKKYNLTKTEINQGNSIIKDLSKVDNALIDDYVKALKTIKNRLKETNLLKFGKQKGLQELVKKYDNDVVFALNKWMKTKAGKEFLQEAGMYELLGDIMEEPDVSKWVNEKIAILDYAVTDNVRALLEKDGYDWVSAKEAFGAIQKDDPDFTNERSEKENTLLKRAYLSGWRPWPEGEDPNEENIKVGKKWLADNPEFQTEKFKENLKGSINVSNIGVDVDDVNKERYEKIVKNRNQQRNQKGYTEELDSLLNDFNKTHSSGGEENYYNELLNYFEEVK